MFCNSVLILRSAADCSTTLQLLLSTELLTPASGLHSILSQTQSYIMTDSGKASLSWCQATHLGRIAHFSFLLLFILLMWSALSDGKTGL
jgi:hypothetical protein